MTLKFLPSAMAGAMLNGEVPECLWEDFAKASPDQLSFQDTNNLSWEFVKRMLPSFQGRIDPGLYGRVFALCSFMQDGVMKLLDRDSLTIAELQLVGKRLFSKTGKAAFFKDYFSLCDAFFSHLAQAIVPNERQARPLVEKFLVDAISNQSTLQEFPAVTNREERVLDLMPLDFNQKCACIRKIAERARESFYSTALMLPMLRTLLQRLLKSNPDRLSELNSLNELIFCLPVPSIPSLWREHLHFFLDFNRDLLENAPPNHLGSNIALLWSTHHVVVDLNWMRSVLSGLIKSPNLYHVRKVEEIILAIKENGKAASSIANMEKLCRQAKAIILNDYSADRPLFMKMVRLAESDPAFGALFFEAAASYFQGNVCQKLTVSETIAFWAKGYMVIIDCDEENKCAKLDKQKELAMIWLQKGMELTKLLLIGKDSLELEDFNDMSVGVLSLRLAFEAYIAEPGMNKGRFLLVWNHMRELVIALSKEPSRRYKSLCVDTFIRLMEWFDKHFERFPYCGKRGAEEVRACISEEARLLYICGASYEEIRFYKMRQRTILQKSNQLEFLNSRT